LLADCTRESGISSIEVNSINEISNVVFDACKGVATAEGCLRPFIRNWACFCNEKCKNRPRTFHTCQKICHAEHISTVYFGPDAVGTFPHTLTVTIQLRPVATTI